MDANDQLIEEYKFLRIELEAIWGQSYTTINFILALVGFIASSAYSGFSSSFANGHGAEGHRHVILLMASVVTGGGYWLVKVHATRVWRIVGYMRLWLEPKLSIRWETYLADRLAQVAGAKMDSTIFGGHLAVLGVVNVALSVGMAVDLIAHPKYWEWVEIGVPIGLALYPFIGEYLFRRGGTIEKAQFEAWETFFSRNILSQKSGSPDPSNPPEKGENHG